MRLKQTYRVVAREVVDHGNGWGMETIKLECGHERSQVIPIRHDINRRPANMLSCRECQRERE